MVGYGNDAFSRHIEILVRANPEAATVLHDEQTLLDARLESTQAVPVAGKVWGGLTRAADITTGRTWR